MLQNNVTLGAYSLQDLEWTQGFALTALMAQIFAESQLLKWNGYETRKTSLLYSYFEKVCQKRCTRQSQKVLWVGLSSLFFKEIWKNSRRGHGSMFTSAKGKQQKQVRQLQCQEHCIDHIPYYLSRLSRGHFFRQPFSKQLFVFVSFSGPDRAQRSIAFLSFELTDRQKHRINLFSHSFLLREHMNPQLTYSQRQWLRSSVGRASHRYREVTGSNPVEVLNFFQASLRNCINCVHCDDHFFIFISFPQFIYDLFHISLTKNKGLCTVRELPT